MNPNVKRAVGCFLPSSYESKKFKKKGSRLVGNEERNEKGTSSRRKNTSATIETTRLNTSEAICAASVTTARLLDKYPPTSYERWN